MSEALRVVVTGAAGQIGYSLLLPIASGSVFGADQKIDLVLLDIPPMMVTLEGVRMELDDCALPLLNKIVCSSDAATAFEKADVAILVGAMPRKEGMERKDLLKANVRIFKAQGEAINNHAKKSIKILVVGNPANTNALICSKYAPDIPKSAFSCLTRLDQNRAQAQIAIRAGVAPDCVYNCVIWGNHSSTQYPDVRNAKIKKDDKTLPASEVISDEAWIKGEFVTTVQKRGAAVIAARKLSSAMSAAKAICDHMRDWWNGTPEGKWASMGVFSDGSYKIPEGLMYSFPVTIKNKECTIVKGLSIDDFSQSKMDLTQKELEDERDVALAACESD